MIFLRFPKNLFATHSGLRLRGKASAFGAFAVLLFSGLLVQCSGESSEAGASGAGDDVSSAVAQAVPVEAAQEGSFDHSDYDALLHQYVSGSGMVDYVSLRANRGPLDLYIQRIGDVPAARFETWSRDERLAFHINAYNAITILRIIDHYPPKGLGLIWPKISIKNIDGVWKKLRNRVAGKEITLDELEHEILRVDYNEPRIHVAIVCAALACPKLQAEAYTADRLEAQLTAAAEEFARDTSKNRIDRASGKAEISSIWDWFAEDFERYKSEVPAAVARGGKTKKFAGGLGFLAKYGTEETREFLKSGDYKTTTLKYDWTLNAQ